MTPVISRDEFKDALGEFLRVEPGGYAELVQLFYREDALYEPRRVSDYLFIAENTPASRAENKVFRFGPRKADERLLARMAFDVENRGVAGHTGVPPSEDVMTPAFPPSLCR
jgi:hypothetical protein